MSMEKLEMFLLFIVKLIGVFYIQLNIKFLNITFS